MFLHKTWLRAHICTDCVISDVKLALSRFLTVNPTLPGTYDTVHIIHLYWKILCDHQINRSKILIERRLMKLFEYNWTSLSLFKNLDNQFLVNREGFMHRT